MTIRKCAMCKKEIIIDKEKSYTFAVGALTTSPSKRIHYGRFCTSCFSKLYLEGMDK